MKHTRILAAVAVLLCVANPAANAQILFQDNFQSDTAGTSLTVADLDPVIGAGDIGGSWTIIDGSSGNQLPIGVQVHNELTPNSNVNGTPGANNYLRIYRSTITQSGKPYATGWNTASTLNQVVQLNMTVWQEDLGSPDTVGAGLMNVMFGSATPQNLPQNASPWLNSLSAWAQLGSADVAGDALNPPQINFPDNQWLPVSIIANLSSTDTQNGLAPQTFSVSINNGTPTTHNFWSTQNTVQSILVGWGGINEHFEYIDDITIQINSVPEPSTWALLGVGILFSVWRKQK